jgi:hypothetical protein
MAAAYSSHSLSVSGTRSEPEKGLMCLMRGLPVRRGLSGGVENAAPLPLDDIQDLGEEVACEIRSPVDQTLPVFQSLACSAHVGWACLNSSEVIQASDQAPDVDCT